MELYHSTAFAKDPSRIGRNLTHRIAPLAPRIGGHRIRGRSWSHGGSQWCLPCIHVAVLAELTHAHVWANQQDSIFIRVQRRHTSLRILSFSLFGTWYTLTRPASQRTTHTRMSYFRRAARDVRSRHTTHGNPEHRHIVRESVPRGILVRCTHAVRDILVHTL